MVKLLDTTTGPEMLEDASEPRPQPLRGSTMAESGPLQPPILDAVPIADDGEPGEEVDPLDDVIQMLERELDEAMGGDASDDLGNGEGGEPSEEAGLREERTAERC